MKRAKKTKPIYARGNDETLHPATQARRKWHRMSQSGDDPRVIAGYADCGQPIFRERACDYSTVIPSADEFCKKCARK